MESGVINYFSNSLNFSLLVQGAFFTICMSFVFLYLARKTEQCIKDFSANDTEVELTQRIAIIVTDTFAFFRNNVLNANASSSSDSKIFWYDQKNKSQKSVRGAISLLSALLVAVVIVVSVFASGILVNRVADTALDLHPSWHLGLKQIWIKSNYSYEVDSAGYKIIRHVNFVNETDNAIKIHYFNKIYKAAKYFSDETKLEIYYGAKHKVLDNDKWANYLIVSQTLINYSQVLVLTFLVSIYVLYFVLFVNVVGVVGREVKGKRIMAGVGFCTTAAIIIIVSFSIFIFNIEWCCISVVPLCLPMLICIVQFCFGIKGSSRIPVNTVLIYLCTFLYVAAGSAWNSNEGEFDAKVLGVYKTITNNFYVNELDYLQKEPKYPNFADTSRKGNELDSLTNVRNLLNKRIDSVKNNMRK